MMTHFKGEKAKELIVENINLVENSAFDFHSAIFSPEGKFR